MRTLSILILTLLLSACAGGLGLQPPPLGTTPLTPPPL